MRVTIPSDFFYREAKQEYYNLGPRLVAELIQNSYDAGAKNIHLTFTDDGYTCEDDGRGMSQEVLVNGMLTLGGTVKDNNSTGGFGAAKKLILFAHESYELHTNDILVKGSVLDYEISKTSPRQGTKISCVYSGEFESMIYAAKNFLEKCSLNCNVYINGELFTNYVELNPTECEIGQMTIIDGESYYANVLHNGLFMFERYLGGKAKKKVIINVFGNSKEIFSQSRDCFRDDYNIKFNTITKKITQEGLSFGKEKPKKTVFQGVNRMYSFVCEMIQKLDTTQKEILQLKLNTILEGDWKSSFAGASAVQQQQIREVVKTEFDMSLPTDFHVLGEYKNVYHPVTGQKKYKMLLNLYRVCLEDISRVFELSMDYGLGFCENDYEGMFGDDIFYINPKLADLKGRDKFYKVLSVALHEFTHRLGYMEHNEEFASVFTDVVYKSKDMAGMVELVNRAKKLL